LTIVLSVLFPLTIVLSVLFQFTDSDYPFVSFKLFFTQLTQHDTNMCNQRNMHIMCIYLKYKIWIVFVIAISVPDVTLIKLNMIDHYIFTIMHMIGWLKMNERLPDITSLRILLLDVSLSMIYTFSH